jgi:hypothetical protein
MISSAELAQRPGTKSTGRKLTISPTHIICNGESIPKGYVVVGYRSSAKCAENPELVIKKPAEVENVCDDSPIPEGYHVVSQQGSTACVKADSNPLTNALTIARDGSEKNSPSTCSPSDVHIGMTSAKVAACLGIPSRISTVVSGSGKDEVWTYTAYDLVLTSLTFHDGRLVSAYFPR